MKRQSINKKLRFEVFKRDNFTCQYCGRKAPDIVLNVDHIVPVSKGGTNELLNLTTSCFDCNNGKRDVPLNDASVLNKQRLQLEQLQERREQIEMMFNWKKSLEHLDDFTYNLLVEYVNSKISPYTLTDIEKNKLFVLCKKFSINEIFDAIDQGVKNYLKYDTNGYLTEESTKTFISKLDVIAAYQKIPPVEQKMHYIKGICRNRFSYWDDKKGLVILNSYIKALRSCGWTDDRILQDLKINAMDLAKTANSWTEWRETMEDWIQEINNSEKETKDNNAPNSEYEMELSEIKETIKEIFDEISDLFELMDYLSIPFENKKVDRLLILTSIENYIHSQIAALINNNGNEPIELAPHYRICNSLHFFDTMKEINSRLEFTIEYMFSTFAIIWTDENLYLPSRGLSNIKDVVIFKHYFDQSLSEFRKTL